jgi:uncharacterized repeat protein (TIGR03803 family)
MKRCIKKLLLLPVLIAGLGLMLAGRVTAQSYATLHIFTRSDGANPTASLILSGNTLYGTTGGTVFAINTDGTDFTNLYEFTGGSDGAIPEANLILLGNTLYGTTAGGGNSGNGTVFAIKTDGTGFTNLYSFTAHSGSPPYGNTDGASPEAGLILSGNTLYGTAAYGGSSDDGTVFAINTDGTSFTNLYSFTARSGASTGTNNDGAVPEAGLILWGNTLFGETYFGGSSSDGTVFAVTTNGTAFTNLYNFIGGSDGANPECGLILSGNTLYGIASDGFSSINGTVFAINTDGMDFTNLYSFTDYAYPQAGLILSGNTLYGTTGSGGIGAGSVFAINTDGTGFTNLYEFNPANPSNGNDPQAGLILSGNTLYGTTYFGGTNADGVVFALSLGPIPLNIQATSNAVVMNWGNPAFSLQAATNVSGIYANVPGATSPYTNTISDSQMFFRLQAN